MFEWRVYQVESNSSTELTDWLQRQCLGLKSRFEYLLGLLICYPCVDYEYVVFAYCIIYRQYYKFLFTA